jgi:predicted DNA-binding transcriptional regulator AlpA
MTRHQPLTAEELKVLTLKQWAALNAISWQTAKRLIREGNGPQTIQLSPRRMGIRMIDNRTWQEERVRT